MTPAITRNQGVKLTRKITMTKRDKDTITGACALGTRHFCETILGDKKKNKYTVAEVIELTKGRYGAESFKDFFKK